MYSFQQAPEVEKWNQYKDDLKRGRKRKLRGTLGDLMSVITGGDKQEQQQQQQQQDTNNPPLKAGDRDEWPSESSGIFTASEMSQASPPAAAAQNSNATTLPLQLPVCRQANLKGVKCKCEYLIPLSIVE